MFTQKYGIVSNKCFILRIPLKFVHTWPEFRKQLSKIKGISQKRKLEQPDCQ